MKPLLVVLALLVAAAVGALLTAINSGNAVPPDGGNVAPRGEVGELRRQLQDLERRIDELDLAKPALAVPQRSDAAALEPRTPGDDPERRGPHWYLERYVLSFTVDPLGSEYFRLAVEAHVVDLASPIAALVRDGGRPIVLRKALVDMLGKRRFDETPEVLDALLAAVHPPAPEDLAQRALEALARIGSAYVVPGLEAVIPSLRESALRDRALAVLADLAGQAVNGILARLYARAPDDGLRQMLVLRLDGADSQAALDLLRTASGHDQPVRLAAAKKVGEYDEAEFDAFTAEWRRVETDAEVQAVLGAKPGVDAAAGWSPKQATGAPDADRTRDDPKAWAPREPQMGRQWLQLTYDAPTRAHGVRIFEVNAPGAVAEVLARASDGPWVTVWRGNGNGGQGPLLLSFPLTTFAVKSIRLVLDTDRTPGWNEIDAVELLGPSGSQWAARASASSTYASTRTEGNLQQAREMQAFERAIRGR